MPGSSPGNWRGQLGPNGPLSRRARQNSICLVYSSKAFRPNAACSRDCAPCFVAPTILRICVAQLSFKIESCSRADCGLDVEDPSA